MTVIFPPVLQTKSSAVEAVRSEDWQQMPVIIVWLEEGVAFVSRVFESWCQRTASLGGKVGCNSLTVFTLTSFLPVLCSWHYHLARTIVTAITGIQMWLIRQFVWCHELGINIVFHPALSDVNSVSYCVYTWLLQQCSAAVPTRHHDSSVSVQSSVKLESNQLSMIVNSVSCTCRAGVSILCLWQIYLHFCFDVHNFDLFSATSFLWLKCWIMYWGLLNHWHTQGPSQFCFWSYGDEYSQCPPRTEIVNLQNRNYLLTLF
jgi:hypothetical protein